MKLGSLFDGSGGFPLAGAMCGFEPVWAAEVEPYPIAVTTSRFPTMKHLGDVSKVNGAEIESMKSHEEREAWLASEIGKIFRRDPYPEEWVDSLEKERKT